MLKKQNIFVIAKIYNTYLFNVVVAPIYYIIDVTTSLNVKPLPSTTHPWSKFRGVMGQGHSRGSN